MNITSAIFIVLFLGFLVAGLNILPVAGGLSVSISSAIAIIIGYMKAWNFFFPITELFICFGIVMTIEIVIWGWHGIKWLIHLFSRVK